MTLNDLLVIIIGTVALIPTYVICVEIYHRAPMWAQAFGARFLVMSSDDGEEEPEEAIDPPVLQLAKDPANVIATPQNGNNDAVVIAVLAKLVAAGKVGQTDAIKAMGVTPSSTSARYSQVRDALKAAVERLNGPAFPTLTPEQQANRERLGLP